MKVKLPQDKTQMTPKTPIALRYRRHCQSQAAVTKATEKTNVARKIDAHSQLEFTLFQKYLVPIESARALIRGAKENVCLRGSKWLHENKNNLLHEREREREKERGHT